MSGKFGDSYYFLRNNNNFYFNFLILLLKKEYIMPSLNQVMIHKKKDSSNAILAIEFSSKGEMLAVSYSYFYLPIIKFIWFLNFKLND